MQIEIPDGTKGRNTSENIIKKEKGNNLRSVLIIYDEEVYLLIYDIQLRSKY